MSEHKIELLEEPTTAEKLSASLDFIARSISLDCEDSLSSALEGLSVALEHMVGTDCERTEATVHAVRYAAGDIAEATQALAKSVDGLAAAVSVGLSQVAGAISKTQDTDAMRN